MELFEVHYRIHKTPPPEPEESNLCPHPTTRRFLLILSSHLRLCLSSGLFLSGFSTKTLYAPPPYVLNALPISCFSVWSPEQHLVRITDHVVPDNELLYATGLWTPSRWYLCPFPQSKAVHKSWPQVRLGIQILYAWAQCFISPPYTSFFVNPFLRFELWCLPDFFFRRERLGGEFVGSCSWGTPVHFSSEPRLL